MESITAMGRVQGDKFTFMPEQSKESILSEIGDYKLNMFRVAQSILLNAHDAEDAVCDSILSAYNALHKLRNRDRVKPWIMKILVRQCYRILKRRARIEYCAQLPDIPARDDENPQRLWEYVCRLSDEQRAAVTLFYYEDMSILAVSQTLGLPQGTVKSRLSRGKAKLKEMIEKDGGLDYDRF